MEISKTQLISFISNSFEDYFGTNTNEDSGDIAYHLGVKNTVDGLLDCIKHDINELSCKPDIREKVREYIGELDMEIDRLESDLEKQMTYNAEACKVTATESRLNAIIEVKNDLQGILEEVV